MEIFFYWLNLLLGFEFPCIFYASLLHQPFSIKAKRTYTVLSYTLDLGL